MNFSHFTIVLFTIALLIFLPLNTVGDLQSNSSNQIEFNSTMGSESQENLDKCFEVVSTVVKKAGDVSIFVIYYHSIE